ncbi:SseB family protein [Leucobacter sp. UT-8R-CII-1-4]|uniref:SseB family protein n=1 Tax=Leucobacter sp. UT-8R-CII-1-4 TaxID=3040075 RepID=UPI0024A93C98|nr:SseB family protein [Leucobacter sp. UT-8R-CII-1-4]MDI6022878.1 SseB family protein [Leucobacter sp. UT-8R-CII-1-4]
MAEAQIPEGITADYVNEEVRDALSNLQSDPDYNHLAAFLNSLREGYLVADVTGTQKKKSTHVRTIRSTKGLPVLPLFTSMEELRLAHPKDRREQAKGAIMPAFNALKLIESSPFVAVQFNTGSASLPVVRKYIALVLSDSPITAESLQAKG